MFAATHQPTDQDESFKQINDTGVYYLKVGLYENAIDSFIKALQRVNLKIATIDFNALSLNPSPSFIGSFGMSSCTYSTKQENSNDVFIFRHPIITIDDIEINAASCSAILVVATYNMALSYHLSAMQYCSDQRLKLALQYYSSAYKTLSDKNDAMANSAIAILNNMGQCHLLLNEQNEATDCFQKLLNAMVSTHESDRIENWVDLRCNAIRFADKQNTETQTLISRLLDK